ncbi:MAG: hypothetical protein H6624_10815 [Bdellovibrionaceae bacterium]|nr:hypothetical protein [Bdellovibrionales bacterium]MCB9084828.1 hypothetical protein [Pseudobdellovibrionaceae bacterium]
MKFSLPQFNPGDVVEAQVVELQRDGSMVVRFQGDLIRVHNQTAKKFRLGQSIDLVVTAVRPYAFRLAEPGRGRFDISI